MVQIEESLAADDLEIHVGHDLTTTNLTTVTDNESASPGNYLSTSNPYPSNYKPKNVVLHSFKFDNTYF